MTYVLMNRATGEYARADCAGQHDGKFTDDVADAKEFVTFGQASDFSQNFGDDWQPEALFADQGPVSLGRAISREIPAP